MYPTDTADEKPYDTQGSGDPVSKSPLMRFGAHVVAVGSVTVVLLLACVPGVMLVVNVVRELIAAILAPDTEAEEVGVFGRQEQADERAAGELPHLSINVGTSVGAMLMVVVNVAQKACAAAVDLCICRMQLSLL